MSTRKKTETKAAAKPAEKPVAKKTAAAKAPAAKKTPAAKKSPAKKETAAAGMSPGEHYQRVQYEAYLLAEKNGFAGDACEYWVQAEKIVSARFA